MPDGDPQGGAGSPRGRERVGWVLIALGLLGILWGVLYMNARALGGPPPERTFAHRRSYDTVKGAAHTAFPGFLLRAGSGLVLLIVGARLRRGPLTRPRGRG